MDHCHRRGTLLPLAAAVATAITVAITLAGVSAERHVTVGETHTCAIRPGGTVACYGDDKTGQSTPPAGALLHAVSAGEDFTCGLRTNGSLVCWGALPGVTTGGPGNTVFSVSSPAALDVSAGRRHVCVLAHSGAVACYGDGAAGATTPPAGVSFQGIGAGSNFTCGVTRVGGVACWGAATNPAVAGVAAAGVGAASDLAHVAAGLAHACAVSANGSLTCWGAGSPAVAAVPPRAAQPAGGYRWVTAGGTVACAVETRAPGTLVCWGATAALPAGVAAAAGNEVACGTAHCCTGGGALTCWPTGASANVTGNVDNVRAQPTVAAAAGTGVSGSGDGAAGAATFVTPSGLSLDTATSALWVADAGSHKIRRIASAGSGAVTTPAGSSTPGAGFTDGPAATAAFNTPTGIVAVPGGGVYIADRGNHAIRWLSADGATVVTVAGAGVPGAADGLGKAASFVDPSGLALATDGSGTVYIADAGNHKVRALSPATGAVTTYAGSGQRGFVNAPAVATNATFAFPAGVAAASDGVLVVVDTFNHALRLVAARGGAVTTLAGDGTAGSTDGVGSNARFNYPAAAAFDAAGDLYVIDAAAGTLLRKVSRAGGVTTLLSSGVSSGKGVAVVVSTGVVLVADGGSHKVLSVTPTTTSTACSTLPTYTATDALLSWRMQSLGSGAAYGSVVLPATGSAMPAALAPAHTLGWNPAVTSLDARGSGVAGIAAGTFTNGSVASVLTSLGITLPALAPGTLPLPHLRTLLLQTPPATPLLLSAGAFDTLPALSCLNCGATPGLLNLSVTGAHTSLAPGTGAAVFALDALRGATGCAGVDLGANNISTFTPPTAGWALPDLVALRVCGGGNPGAPTLFTSSGAFAAFPAVSGFAPSAGLVRGVLDMRGCNAPTAIPAAWAPNATAAAAVTAAYLGSNGITSLTPNYHGVLTLWAASLATLDMSANALTTVRPADLAGFTALTTLDLSGNANLTLLDAAALTTTATPALRSVAVGGTGLAGGAARPPCPAGSYNDVSLLAGGASVPVCAVCPPGAYCVGGTRIACSAGTYNDAAGADLPTACAACPPGTTNPLTGQTRAGCALCARGTASAAAGANMTAACAPCSPGFYSAASGAAGCDACPAGTYNAGSGAASAAACTACPSDTYSLVAGANSSAVCTPCPSGTNTLSAGASSADACFVVPCAAGLERNTTGACVACPTGKYSTQGVCTPCPAGTFGATTRAAACTQCPLGTYSSALGANSSATCRACPLGTVCTATATACTALCPADTRISAAVATALAPYTDVCAMPPANLLAAVCTACSSSAVTVCEAGDTAPIPLLSRLFAAEGLVSAAMFAPGAGIRNMHVSFADAATCAEYTARTLDTGLTAHAEETRQTILIDTAVLAVGLPAVLAFLMYVSRNPWLIKRMLGMDMFGATHDVPDGEVLRNQPNLTGGVWSISFLVAGIGLSIALLVPLFLHLYLVSQSIVDTPPPDPTVAQPPLYYGPLAMDVLLVGPADAASCSAVTVTAAPATAGGPQQTWVQLPPFAEPLATASVWNSVGLYSLPTAGAATACRVVALCIACYITAPTVVTVTAPRAFQSVVVKLQTAAAYKSCTPTFVHLYSAVSPQSLLADVALSVQVRPVLFTYSGSYAGSDIVPGTGHDVVLVDSDVTTVPSTGTLHPDIDRTTVTLSFSPTPYTTLIATKDAVDPLAIVTGILGLLSGLLGGYNFLLGVAEKMCQRRGFLYFLLCRCTCSGGAALRAATLRVLPGSARGSARDKPFGSGRGSGPADGSSSSRGPGPVGGSKRPVVPPIFVTPASGSVGGATGNPGSSATGVHVGGAHSSPRTTTVTATGVVLDAGRPGPGASTPVAEQPIPAGAPLLALPPPAAPAVVPVVVPVPEAVEPVPVSASPDPRASLTAVTLAPQQSWPPASPGTVHVMPFAVPSTTDDPGFHAIAASGDTAPPGAGASVGACDTSYAAPAVCLRLLAPMNAHSPRPRADGSLAVDDSRPSSVVRGGSFLQQGAAAAAPEGAAGTGAVAPPPHTPFL